MLSSSIPIFRLLRPCAVTLSQSAGMKQFLPPPDYSHVEIPEKPKLSFIEKVPIYPNGVRAPKMKRRLGLIRGPETLLTEFIYKQYGIVALCGGRLNYGHFNMIRTTINKFDAKKMFAVWRVDPPWQPLTRKGQGKRMGGGKGAIDHYVTPVKAGRVIIEIGGKIEFEEALPYLKEVAQKLPFKAKATSYDLMIQERQKEKELEALNINPYTAEYVIKNNLGGCHKWLSKYDKKWFWKHV